jgi:hypothetical protein
MSSHRQLILHGNLFPAGSLLSNAMKNQVFQINPQTQWNTCALIQLFVAGNTRRFAVL